MDELIKKDVVASENVPVGDLLDKEREIPVKVIIESDEVLPEKALVKSDILALPEKLDVSLENKDEELIKPAEQFWGGYGMYLFGDI